MEKIDLILELLGKKTLNESELKVLSDISDSDEEIKNFISIYKTIDSSISSPDHIHPDLLSSYILYEMGDDSERNFISLIASKIKSHLDECTECRNEYNLLIEEFESVDRHIKKSIINTKGLKVQTDSPLKIMPNSFRSFKFAFATLSILIIGYFALYFISPTLIPDYKKNVFSNNNDDFYRTRGRTSELFQQGLNSIGGGDYSEAIKYLSEDIKENQNEKSIFYTHYIIGLTYLKISESSFFGLFKAYNHSDVMLAINNLKKSVIENDSGDYENLKLDAYYYIGRAYLLINDFESAKSSLEKVISGKGRYSSNAKDLIKLIGKN